MNDDKDVKIKSGSDPLKILYAPDQIRKVTRRRKRQKFGSVLSGAMNKANFPTKTPNIQSVKKCMPSMIRDMMIRKIQRYENGKKKADIVIEIVCLDGNDDVEAHAGLWTPE